MFVKSRPGFPYAVTTSHPQSLLYGAFLTLSHTMQDLALYMKTAKALTTLNARKNRMPERGMRWVVQIISLSLDLMSIQPLQCGVPAARVYFQGSSSMRYRLYSLPKILVKLWSLWTPHARKNSTVKATIACLVPHGKCPNFAHCNKHLWRHVECCVHVRSLYISVQPPFLKPAKF